MVFVYGLEVFCTKYDPQVEMKIIEGGKGGMTRFKCPDCGHEADVDLDRSLEIMKGLK